MSGGAVDIAAKQHQAMPAVSEVWAKEAKIGLRSQKVQIRDGIERFKESLKVNPLTGRPSIFFNIHRCKGVISELGGCPNPLTGQTAVYTWRLDRDGTIIGDKPEDKNDHGVKAVWYGLIDRLGYPPSARRRAKIKFW